MTKRFLTTVAAGALIATAAAAQDSETMIGTENITFQGGDVTFPDVTAAEDGYLVLHEVDEDGNVVAPASVGVAPVSAGENMEVVVSSEADLERGTDYVAMLHAETNGNDTYEFAEGMADVDTPVTMDGEPVTVRFTVPMEGQDASMDMATDAARGSGDDMSSDTMASDGATSTGDDMMPGITIEGASIEGDTVTIPRIVAKQEGYIVIHTILDDQPVVPASIGHAPVTAGVNESVEVTIDYPFAAGERYLAMLHVESNGNETYDFGEGSTDVDTPVTMDGEIVAQSFQGG